MNRDTVISLVVALGWHTFLFGIPLAPLHRSRPQKAPEYVEVSLLAGAPTATATGPLTAIPAVALPSEPAIEPSQPDLSRPERRVERPKREVLRAKTRPPAQPSGSSAAHRTTPAPASTSQDDSLVKAASSGTGTEGTDHSSPPMAAMFIDRVKPVYPAGAKRLNQQGRVVVRLYVSVSGKIEKVEIAESSGFPLLDDAALTAAQRSRMRPAYVRNRPIDSRVEAPYRFVLKDG